jgi:hypothetical protein
MTTLDVVLFVLAFFGLSVGIFILLNSMLVVRVREKVSPQNMDIYFLALAGVSTAITSALTGPLLSTL